MKKYYGNALIAISLTLMLGCHTFSGSNFQAFRFGPSDEKLATTVNEVMLSNPELSTVHIHVESHQGNIHLTGYVKTIRQSDTAGDLAKRVAGVRTVQNDLIVRK